MEPSLTGAQFHKADLHTHTPASKDFADRTASPEDIIQAAEQAGITILGITDHNSATWVDQVRKASKGSAVTVIPGVEITTPEGHILALFEIEHDATKITDLLISVGIPREKHGGEEAISTEHAENVVRRIHDAGGLAIAAHANENNGLLKTKGQYKLKIVPMRELAALELTKQEEIERFCAGTVSRDYPPKACMHSSDSHALAEIGRRTTYLKMHRASLRGIRQALLDHEVKVRFPWNYKEPAHPRLVSLTVDQGFFGGQRFVFHESLNCLVGGKGTGKSTVVELLRYCFDDMPGFEHIREDHEGKIKTLVGDGGTVEVELIDVDGELKIVRREVQPWETSREVRDVAGNPASIAAPPAFFSQGELVEIARSPLAQLDLIDRRLDLGAENRSESETIEGLRTNSRELVAARQKTAKLEAEISHPETGKVATKAQHDQLERQLKEPILKEFPLWEAEQRYLSDLDAALEALPAEIDESLDTVELDAFRQGPPTDGPNAKLLKPLELVGDKVDAAVAKAKSGVAATVKALRRELQETGVKLAPLFAAKKKQHDSVLQGLGQADTRKANAQFRSLGKRLESLHKFEEECAKLGQRVKKAETERGRLVAQLKKIREDRWKKRVQKATEYESRLNGLVRIRVVAQGDRAAFAKKIRELSRRGYLKEGEIRQIAKSVDPDLLLRHVLNRDAEKIVQATNVTSEVAKRLVESFSGKEPSDLYEIAVVPLPDLPEVTYVVEPGREKTLGELSTGQKGTVIIELAMIEGAGPLVIDHPEEPLDTQSIYGQVVKTLRRGKDTRQFVFTTHNANVAVGADAELSHILDATADKGRIESSGAVDDEKTNKLLLVHLEGGPEALERRVQKYRL